MLEFAKSYPEALRALPEEPHETLKLSREFIGNVLYTIIGSDFQSFVDGKINARNAKIKKQEDMIQMDPELAAIYQ